MDVKSFLLARQRIYKPVDVDDGSDDRLKNCQSVFVPVITPNGVLISVQKKIEFKSLSVPYTTYSNDFMLKNGVKQLKDVPLSSFAVFDSIKNLLND